MVDQRTLEKYEREAKEAGRESWYLSWALDLNQEERAKVGIFLFFLFFFFFHHPFQEKNLNVPFFYYYHQQHF